MLNMMSGNVMSLLTSVLLSYSGMAVLATEPSQVNRQPAVVQGNAKSLPDYSIYDENGATNDDGQSGISPPDKPDEASINSLLRLGSSRNEPFSGILRLILGEILKNGEGDFGKVPANQWNRQQKKTGENFIRFGRKRRGSSSRLYPNDQVRSEYYNAPYPMSAPKLTRWDHGQDCPDDDGQQPWIMVSSEPFKDDRKEDAPGDDTFIRFGKGSSNAADPVSSTAPQKIRVRCKLQQ